jgi:alpha-D-xyloside xylohydrolase
MKFTNGYWEIHQGVTPYYAAQVHEVTTEPEEFTVYAATQKIENRGNTLNSSILTIHYSSPMENVIKVETWHHKGVGIKKPGYPINTQPDVATVIEDSDKMVCMTRGDLTVQVNKGQHWLVEFKDSESVLTQSVWRSLGYVDTDQGRFIHEQLELGVGEYVYGLGERFTPFVKNGQVVDMWNEDGGTSSELAYKNIPFYLTNQGYGVFIAHPERVSFEVGSEKVERVQFSVPGESLTYYLIYGPTPKEIL